MTRRTSLARAEAGYAALRRAVGPDGRSAALGQLARARTELADELAELDAPDWLAQQLLHRLATRPAEVVRLQLHQEATVDQNWLDSQIRDAVLDQNLDRLQELADYARDEDPDTTRDIHNRLIKPHQTKWGKGKKAG